MNRIKTMAAALLLLACALPSFAQPVMLDTKWNQKTFSISTTGVTSVTIDVAGFGAAGYNLIGTTRTLAGVDGTVYGATITATSADTNIVGFSWSGLALGGSASLKIAQTIKTPSPFHVSSSGFNSPQPNDNNFTVPLISTSATITLPASISVSDRFSAQVSNPVFIFSGLTAAGTLYFTLDYGVPKVP